MTAPLSLRFPAEPGSVSAIRTAVVALARECGMQDGAVADVRLAVSEAATNAIVHGSRNGGEIRLQATIVGDELLVSISDDGAGMKPRPDSPGLGLGLPTIATVARRIEVISEGAGTEVRIAFACPHAA
jgi:anti-sigma regulatory factor (Ser/Thr protein kinase)